MNYPPRLGLLMTYQNRAVPSVAAPGVAIGPGVRAEREKETLGAKSGDQEEGL